MSVDTIKYVNWKGKSKTISCKRWDINEIMPIKESNDFTYVLLDDIKKACSNNDLDFHDFLDWIVGQTCPLVESEGDCKYECFYTWDVYRWFYYKLKHNVTPRVLD